VTPGESAGSAGPSRDSAGPERVTYLDLLKNNRNNRPLNRGRNCARITLRGTDLRPHMSEKAIRYQRLNCNCWDCPFCGPKKQRLYREAIGLWAKNLGLNRFITLTLDPKKFLPGISYLDFQELHDDDPEKQRLKKLSAEYLRRCFSKLRVYLGREYGTSIKYICVLELHKSGMPHLHLLVDRYIPIEWLRKSWTHVGGGFEIKIKRVQVRSAAAYISKYLSKQLRMKVPPRTRRITTSRSIRLFPVTAGPKYLDWEMQKQSIWEAWDWKVEVGGNRVISVDVDKDGFLESFSIVARESPP
jgi:hypothetical protein